MPKPMVATFATREQFVRSAAAKQKGEPRLALRRDASLVIRAASEETDKRILRWVISDESVDR